MTGLIAFALLILACSYCRVSSAAADDERRREQGKTGEGPVIVIVAGNDLPTFVATPIFSKASLVAPLGTEFKVAVAGDEARVLFEISIGIASPSSIFPSYVSTRRFSSSNISCVQWDPEGLFRGPPQTGHIARLEFKKRLEKDAGAREEFEKQMREEKQRRLALRESRIAPDTSSGLIEYFLDTEAQEIEFEIARLRPRLSKEFFSELQLELGQLHFAVSKTEEMEDRIIELETLQKALQEGTEAYDKMQEALVKAKGSLGKILSSKDMKATLLDMVETNELNTALLSLLDENIVSAQQANQKQAAEFMEKLRGAVLKYITV